MTESLLVTVMFTDIVRSTEVAREMGDIRWSHLLQQHHARVRAELERFGGSEIDNAGDGFLASFDAPGRAVRCGCAIVEALHPLGLSIRCGLHSGECEVVGDKLGGMAVHIGARIMAEAAPGEVLVSSTVRDLLAGSGLAFEDRGMRALKGIPGEWRLYAADLTALRRPALPARIQLCGQLVIDLDGRRVEEQLPGHQGRMLFGYLTANRRRSVGREELIEALWPERVPDGADAGLSALISKLRRAIGPQRLAGRSSLQLQLPAECRIDLETASEALHRAASALARGDWAGAWGPGRVTQHIAMRPFLPGEEGPWIDDIRRQLGDMYVHSLEITAKASLRLGGSELDTAERSARSLVKHEPYRESGHRLLMEVMKARGNVGEALRVYEQLRALLRDELGTDPSPETRELHRTLLS